MTDISQAPPARAQSSFGALPWFVGMIVGIAAATILAADGFKVVGIGPYAVLFDAMRALVALLVAPIEMTVATPFFAWLNTQNVDTALHDHWRSAFLLLWLLFGRTATSFTEPTPLRSAALWASSGAAALATSLYIGSVPINDLLVVVYAANGFGLFFGSVLLVVWLLRSESQAWFFAYFFIGTVFGTVIRLLWMAHEMPVIATLPSPTLTMLAIAFGALGVANILSGAFLQDGEGDTAWQQFTGSSLTRAGLDIVTVIAVAAALVYTAIAFR